MRKLLTLLTVLMLGIFAANAQSRTITGTVVDSLGRAVPGASVQIKGTSRGMLTTSEGTFSLQANTGDVLVFSEINLGSAQVIVGNENSVTVTLRGSNNVTLEEVVVTTAFNIKKDERTTPYSAQVVNSAKLNIIPQNNLTDALAGKVAGVQFRTQSGAKLNSQSFARIRGGLLVSGDVGPIYVVDGTIVNDGTDIDPNIVDNLTFLKGANATALFGSRASRGAIVITTKKAAAGKTSVDVSEGLTFDNVYIMPQMQNRYGGGASSDFIKFNYEEGMPTEWQALDGQLYPDYTDDASWGPKFEGQQYVPWYSWVPGTKYTGTTTAWTPQPDNNKNFWNTGVNSNTNVNFYSSGKGYNTRISYSKNAIAGIIPSSKSDRNVFSSSTSMDINKVLSAGINLNYATQKIVGEYNDGYANQSSGNFGQWNHRDLDMGIMKELRGLMTPIGTLATWNYRSNPSAYDPNDPGFFWKANYWYNFYGYQDNVSNQQRRDRLYGDIYLNLKLGNHFTVRGTVRKDQYNYYYENVTRSILQQSALQTGTFASYATGQRNQSENNYELIGTYNQRFLNNDLGINALVGGNVFTQKRRDLDASTVNGLIIYDLYSLANSNASPALSNSRLNQRINSVFASGDFEYKRFISATWALRQDWSSTLPVSNNSLFYPSVGFAFIPSEFTKNSISWLSFAKLYGSWGKKPLNLGIYDINFTYPINQNKYNGNVVMNVANTIPSNNLTGALITSYEAGIELRFLKNRIGLNTTFYNEEAANQPLTVQLPGQSGFTGKTVNAATVRTRGLEFILNASVINRKNFTWNITKSLGYILDNKVTQLIEGTDRIQPSDWIGSFGTRYASAFLEKGSDWGQLIGGGFQYSDDGKILINPTTGLYASGDANYHWGSVVPKLTGGLQNQFTYKNFILNASLDYQVGGRFFSLTESWGMFSGLLDYTAATNDRGANVRDGLSDGGGVRVTGVSADDGKTPVDMYVDGYTYFHQFYSAGIAAPFVHKLSYLKLREISVGYAVPMQQVRFANGAIKGITLSVIARNPWLIYSATKNFDPSEISNVYGENGQLPSVRSLGFNVKLNF